MGYTVKYDGDLTIEPPLNEAERRALNAFFNSRRMLTKGGPLDSRNLSSSHPDVIDYNSVAEGQPGLHCDMTLSEDGTLWSAYPCEKNGDLTPWITYVIDHLLKEDAVFSSSEDVQENDPLHKFTFDHLVSGEMKAVGEDGDVWLIRVMDNKVESVKSTFPGGGE